MEIHLHNFMKHKDLKLSFKQGQVTLLTGESESGKSSILYAFFWCLYGKVNKVYRGETEKVSVMLKLTSPKITVYRQARPGKLNVTRNNKYSGSAAQAIIDETFGSKNLWLAASLLQQKKCSHMMECNNDEGMTILKELVFAQESPDTYISQIDKYLHSQQNQYDRLLTQYEVYKQNHDQKYPQAKEPKQNKANLESKLQKIKSKLEQEQNKFKEMTTAVQQHRQAKVKSELLQKELHEISDEMNDLDESKISSEEINRLEVETEQIKEKLRISQENKNKKKQYDLLKTQIETYTPLNTPVSKDLYLEVKAQEQHYEENVKRAKSLKIEYDKDVITAQINKYQQSINIYNSVKDKVLLLSKLEKLESKIASYEPIPVKVTAEEVKAQKKIYDEMEKNSHLLECPECQHPLKYERQKLIKAPSDAKVVLPEQLKSQHNHTKEIYNNFKKYEEYSKLEQELKETSALISDRAKIKAYEHFNLSGITSKLSKLELIQFHSKPDLTSEMIKSELKLKQLQKQLDQLKVNPNFEDQSDILKSELGLKQNELKKLKNDKFKYEQIQKRISNLKKSLEKVKLNFNIEEEYESLKVSLEMTEIKRQEHQTQMELLESFGQLKEHQVKVDVVAENLRVAHVIKEKAINLNCTLLEDLVNTLSLISSNILKSIFEKSVVVEMSLFKKMKSKHNTKQTVNLNIFFDANKHEKRLCGGEEDRISLALLLALNQLSRSPFLLIDEKMGTVSPHIAKKCFKIIKEYTTKDKFAICVEHNVIQGLYDEVIDLNTLED